MSKKPSQQQRQKRAEAHRKRRAQKRKADILAELARHQPEIEIRPDGSRSVPLSPEMMEALKEQRERFKAKFGRDPGPNDSVFFDPDADEPREYPSERMEEEWIRAMTAAGTSPELIYAYKKTGRMVTEDNKKFLTTEELAEWHAALEEYFDAEDAAESSERQ